LQFEVETTSPWLLVVVGTGKTFNRKGFKENPQRTQEKTHAIFFASLAAFLCELCG
jgi:hypothetical protein